VITVSEENVLFGKKFIVLVVHEMTTSRELEDMFSLAKL
jgi:hypothetical protein